MLEYGVEYDLWLFPEHGLRVISRKLITSTREPKKAKLMVTNIMMHEQVGRHTNFISFIIPRIIPRELVIYGDQSDIDINSIEILSPGFRYTHNCKRWWVKNFASMQGKQNPWKDHMILRVERSYYD